MATGENLGGDIREGFLCPFCMTDLGTVVQLQMHFENIHSTEDKAVFHSIKDLFGKAKKRILKLDSLNDEFDGRIERESFVPIETQTTYQEPQEIGVTSSHTEYFKQIRSSRIDRYVVETNKLLIRLDKLITETPFDPASRKHYEKSIVYWVADGDVRFCTSCGRGFNITRRKHHCRLCGCIMCANCSNFILFSFARKLIGPVTVPHSLSQPNSPMHRSGSDSSLNSLLNAAGEPHIRVCAQCKLLLDRRSLQMDETMKRPTIVQLYERLKTSIDEVERLCPIYVKMADSLNAGESNYSLREAVDLRIKLIRHSENIDMLSKRIISLGHDNPSASALDRLLQKSIRSRASICLQEHVVGLPSLPTEEDLQKLQSKRSDLIRKQIAEEKQKALEFHQRQVQAEQSTFREESPKLESVNVLQQRQQRRNENPVGLETGWGPETKTAQSSSPEDPMVQQINNIRNYIKQARSAQKHDEVQILETNLKELMREYIAQKDLENSR